MHTLARLAAFGLLATSLCRAQSLGNAGTIEGTVLDPTGAAVPNAAVVILNRVSGYRQQAITDSKGAFRLNNIPLNPYHLEVDAKGFAHDEQDVEVRTPLPVVLMTIRLSVEGSKESVTVEAAGADILENDPTTHVDVDRSLIMKLPNADPGGGLSQAIVNSTGGVAADGNGFLDRKSTRLNSSHTDISRMPSSA